MLDFIVKYWLEVGFGLLCGAVGAGFKWAKKILKERQAEEEERQKELDTLKEGVLSLLHDRLYQGCMYHITRGWITSAEMKNIEYLYNGYHALGGNGTGTELYERVKNLPLKEE